MLMVLIYFVSLVLGAFAAGIIMNEDMKGVGTGVKVAITLMTFAWASSFLGFLWFGGA